MKKDIFEGKIDLDEFKALENEVLERNTQIHDAKLEIMADHVELLAEKDEKEIVREYLEEIKKRREEIDREYEKNTKGLMSPEKKRKLNENHQAMLTNVLNELTSCVHFLEGNQDVDLSFIQDIRLKRELTGKSREEIIDGLKQIEIEQGDATVEEESKIEATVRYEPIRERVMAVREMAELEYEKKKSTKQKISTFLKWLASIGAATSVYSVIAHFAFGQHALKSVAVMAFFEAVMLAGKGIRHKIEEKKTKEAYEEAMKDFEEVGMKVSYDTYDDVESVKMAR